MQKKIEKIFGYERGLKFVDFLTSDYIPPTEKVDGSDKKPDA